MKRKRQNTNENLIIEDEYPVVSGSGYDVDCHLKKKTRREKAHCCKKMKRSELGNNFNPLKSNNEYSPSEDIENKNRSTGRQQQCPTNDDDGTIAGVGVGGKLFDISNNLPSESATITTTTQQQHLDKKKHICKSLSTSTSSIIVAAQKSSYFLLTPATSTTSLHDVSSLSSSAVDHHHKQRDEQQRKIKAAKQQEREEEDKYVTPATGKIEAAAKTTTTTTTMSTKTRKRAATSRRRPSIILCNSGNVTSAARRRDAHIPQVASEPKISATADTNENQHQHVVVHKQPKLSSSSTVAASKSCSNLQKSKVLADAAAAAETTYSNPIIGGGVSLSQFYLRYAPKNSFYVRHHQSAKFGPSNPMPELTWASSNALWSAMKAKEQTYLRDAAYLKRHQGIKAEMRSILMEWLLEVASAYGLHRETMHLTIEYMDRFMSESKLAMHMDRLQLMGTTALYLASKVEEIYPPTLQDFASKLDTCLEARGDPDEALRRECELMIKFELFMLKTLNWEISPVTANTWLQTYLQIAAINFASFVDTWWTKAALRDSFDDLDFDFVFLNSNPNDSKESREEIEYKTSIVMPLSIYKNSNKTMSATTNDEEGEEEKSKTKSEFFLTNYSQSIALLDLCLFDYDHMQFAYSELAAAALYHTLCSTTTTRRRRRTATATKEKHHKRSSGEARFAAALVEKCSGCPLDEIDRCIKWMQPYADVCEEKLLAASAAENDDQSSNDDENAHNVQTYRDYIAWLKEVKSRKTPSKSAYLNQSLPPTPPDSHRVSVSSASILSSTSFTTLKNTD